MTKLLIYNNICYPLYYCVGYPTVAPVFLIISSEVRASCCVERPLVLLFLLLVRISKSTRTGGNIIIFIVQILGTSERTTTTMGMGRRLIASSVHFKALPIQNSGEAPTASCYYYCCCCCWAGNLSSPSPKILFPLK